MERSTVKRKSKFGGADAKKKVKDFTFAPIEELQRTLNILNTKELVSPARRNMCRDSKRRPTDNAHLSNLHYCGLIKQAILKHNWKDVLKLLLAYIDEPKSDRYTSGIIFKFTLIYLLNDPVARNLNIMDEFLQLALSCQTEAQKSEFMKLITTIPNNNQIK